MKKTILLAAEGFEEVECLTVVDLLRRAGIICEIVSLSGNETVTGSHGIRVYADSTLSSLHPDTVDAVILPGGMPGTTNLAEDGRVLSLLREAHIAGKLIAAICAAPTVLARAGLLSGVHATCYPGLEDKLGDAVISDGEVVRDGSIITSRGVGTAIPFALALIRYLISEEAARSTANSIVWKE